MKTRIFPLLIPFLLFIPSLLFAYTTPGTGVVWSGDDLLEQAGGVVTWNEGEQRYEINQQFVVAENDSIYFFHSVRSSYNGDPDFTVHGSLVFGNRDGLDTDSITVDGTPADGPGGIRIEDGGVAWLFRVILPGGGADGNDDCLRVLSGGDIHMDGCRVTDWAHYGIGFSGAGGEVANTLFHDNHEYTINITLGSSPYIHHCTLIRNNLDGVSPKNPISIGIQGSNSPVIEDCYISGSPGNPHGGISVWAPGGDPSRPVIRRVTVENCAFGIVVSGASAQVLVTDCSLLNSTAMNDVMNYGSGITINTGGYVRAARNLIEGNWWGVTTLSDGRAMLGNAAGETPDEQGQNRIINNGNNGQIYNLYNNTDLNMFAQNNWWGSDDPEVVEDYIFHHPDNPALGTVNYLPLWIPEEPGETMTLPLQANYFELISSYVVPPDLNVETVFELVEGLVIVYRQNGDLYLPPALNTIGDLVLSEGYQVFCDAPSELTIEGILLDPETEYTLNAGPWNWIGYPFPEVTDVETALADIEDDLVIMMNDDGGMWIPSININTLNVLTPGEGYRAIVENDITFQYAAGVLAGFDNTEMRFECTGYHDALGTQHGIQPTGLPYAVIIELTGDLLAEMPSVVEVYDGSLLVGCSTINPGSGRVPVVAWQGSEKEGLQGFREKDPVTIVLRTDNGLPIQTEIRGSVPRFGEAPYATVSLDKPGLPHRFSLLPGYPNPFNPSVTVPFILPEKGDVLITVTNLLGRQVFQRSKLFEAGQHRFLFDANGGGEELVSGMYFLRMEFGDQVLTQKLVLLR